MTSGKLKKNKCYIIGETIVLSDCGEILIEHGFEILGILTDAIETKSWAAKKGIASYPLKGKIISILSEKPFDFLFSIINKKILAPDILSLPKVLAINYHDAPLPKYAGINSNTWAIVHQEKEYGITWHEMVEKLDAGSILEQPQFELLGDETVIDLNLKCYNAAIESFRVLVDKIITGKLTYTEQNLAQRSYVSKSKKPAAGGILQWQNTAEVIYATFRGLRFFPFDNPVACPKIKIDDELYICDTLRIASEDNSGSEIGDIIDCTSDLLSIATTFGKIIIENLLTIDGDKITLGEVISRHQLRTGIRLSTSTNTTNEKIKALHQDISKYEHFWTSQLSNVTPLNLPNWKSQGLTEQKYIYTELSYPTSFKKFIQTFDYDEMHTFITLIVIYLCRISTQNKFSLAFSSQSLQNKVKALGFFFESFVPLNVNLKEGITFSEVYQLLYDKKEDLVKNIGYARDIKRRKKELREKLTTLSHISKKVAIHEIDSSEGPDAVLSAQLEFFLEGPNPSTWGKIAYRPDKIQKQYAENINSQLHILFNSIATDPTAPIYSYPIATPSEVEQIFSEFNQKPIIPIDYSLVDMFEKQVELYPKNIAVVYNEIELTYRQLSDKTDRVACFLKSKYQIHQDDIVALVLERSQWMIIGILGVLKAGAAYLPIAVEAPKKRTEHMLREAKVAVMLTDKNCHLTISEIQSTVAVELIENIRCEEIKNLKPKVKPSDLAYIIFTSGSSGRPKGVMIEHAGVCNLIKYQIAQFNITTTDKILQFSTYTFDTSVEEIFLALVSGAALIMADKSSIMSTSKFQRLIELHKITVLDLPPGFLRALDKQPLSNDVRLIIIGGEKPTEEDINYYSQKQTLINGYGPTETTIVVTNHHYSNEIQHVPKNCIIGKPIAHTEILILDKYQNIMPVGVAGEICISGENVARGYLNIPTSENFVKHPFDSSKRMYKTGDIGQWLNDGNLKFLGRSDDQIKLRGFRIELGEIENILKNHPLINDCVVIVKMNQSGYEELIAYFDSTQTKKLNPTNLKEYTKEHLPSYMVPSLFILTDKIPKNANGKNDRMDLLNRDISKGSTYGIILPPTTSTERKILKIWKEILNYEHAISIDDIFMDIGGNSLLSVLLVNDVEKLFSIEIPFQEFMRIGSIRKMSSLVDLIKSGTKQKVITSSNSDHSKLSPDIYRDLLIYISTWTGKRKDSKSFIFGYNTNGRKLPIFWCCQGDNAGVQLSKQLGNEQPLFTMRSGHKIMNYTDANVENLSELYVNELIENYEQEEYILGANCQAGHIIYSMAAKLIERGKMVKYVFLLEGLIDYKSGKIYDQFLSKPINVPISFIFGDKSPFNPLYHDYLLDDFSKYFIQDIEFKFIPCGHGEYFIEPNIDILSHIIQDTIS